MLDVHPPHAPTHTWRDFFIHIATICVGLLIAIGLEQTVEYFHHRHQLHRLEQALDAENEHNVQNIAQNVALMERVKLAEQANKRSLAQAGAHGKIVYTSSPLTSNDPLQRWVPPVGSVWASARDNGALTLMPSQQATYLSRLDLAFASVAEIQHQLFDQDYRVRGYAQLHDDINALTPQEREEMLLAVSQYEQIANHAQYILVRVRANIEQAH